MLGEFRLIFCEQSGSESAAVADRHTEARVHQRSVSFRTKRSLLPRLSGVDNGQALRNIAKLAPVALDEYRVHPPMQQEFSLNAGFRRFGHIRSTAHRLVGGFSVQSRARASHHHIASPLHGAAKWAPPNVMQGSATNPTGLRLENRQRRPSLRMQTDAVGLDSNIVFHERAIVASSIVLSAIRDQVGCLGRKLPVHSGRRGTRLEVSMPLFRWRR